MSVESTSGVMVHDKRKICDGYRLFNGKLIDVQGRTVRQWKNKYLGFIAHGYYYGQLGYEKKCWGKYTMDDDLVWEKQEAIHHEIISEGKDIITFLKECHPYKGRMVDFDVVATYGPDGILQSTWSTWENLKYLRKFHQALELDLPKIPFLPDIVPPKPTTPWGGNYDYYRINSLQIIPSNQKKFMEGHWLITIRHGSMIFIFDKSKKIVWKAVDKDIKGGLEGPHGAQILANGNMLIFDNGRYRRRSRVIEINPLTKVIKWEYTNENFFTLSQGYAQRLPNGNTLITESENGHAFEITFEGKIVWEFYNTEMQNDPLFPQSIGSREWIYRMIWYPSTIIS